MSDRTVIHFAYGSNMSVRRLQDRVSSARLLGMGWLQGWLPDHRLAFHKRSKDGSGKCDVVPSDTCTVYGVLFQIDSTQETTLDHCEGLNSGYRKKEVRVRVSEERCMLASLYYADNASVDPTLKPYSWKNRRGGSEPSRDVHRTNSHYREHRGSRRRPEKA